MATQPKAPVPPSVRPAVDARRIGQLADDPALFQAQRWFTRERAWINEQHLQICRVPAATFFEQQRAAFLCSQLQVLGWTAEVDRAGNVLAAFGRRDTPRPLVLSAHLDTVFAPGRPEDIYVAPDGRLVGPGTSDNGAGLTALLAIARVLSEDSHLHPLASSVLVVGNVGEEGEGNLNGMRYLCRTTAELSQIVAFVVLDGPSTDHITAQALASRRFEISFTGPGGHSWNDYGTPNPVHALSNLIDSFVTAADRRISSERGVRCSCNFGVVEGGNSINAIPSTARAKLDIRSEEAGVLDDLSGMLTPAIERSLERENRQARRGRLAAKVKELGARPAGKLPPDAGLLRTVRAVDAHLNIRSRIDCASTDANVPLSLGLPAISIGAGGQGGGAHTRDEWYQPDGRELGLRRILLVLAALAGETVAS